MAPTSIPTGQARLLWNQGPLNGPETTIWPKAPMLISGYTLDPLGTAIDKLVLVLERQGIVVWQHDLLAPLGVVDVAAEERREEAQ